MNIVQVHIVIRLLQGVIFVCKLLIVRKYRKFMEQNHFCSGRVIDMGFTMRKEAQKLFLFLAPAAIMLIFSIAMVISPRSSAAEPVAITPLSRHQVRVLVAKHAIPQGARLTEDNMIWMDWPSREVPNMSITQAQRPNARSDYAGYLVDSPFAANEIIQENKLLLP